MKKKKVDNPVVLDFFEGEESDDFIFISVHVDSYNPRMCEMDKWRKGWHAIRCDINTDNGRYSTTTWVSKDFYDNNLELAIKEAINTTKEQYKKQY